MKQAVLVLLLGLTLVNSQIAHEEQLNLADFIKPLERFRRDTADSESTDGGLDKCTSDEVDNLQLKIDNCMDKSSQILIESLVNDRDQKEALCEVIKGRVSCILTLAPTCLYDEHVNNMRINFLFRELGKMRNDSEFFGDAFIKSCPILNDYQNEFIREKFGATNCTSKQAMDYNDAKESCKNTISDRRIFRDKLVARQISDRKTQVSLWQQSYCDFKSAYYKCYDRTTFLCSDESAKKKIKDELDQGFAEDEDDFFKKTEISLKDCPEDLAQTDVETF